MPDIIDQLVSSLKPKPKLNHYRYRLGIWLILSFLWLGLSLIVFGHRSDLISQLSSFTFWAELSASVSICILAAWFGFRLSIPQRDLPWIRYILGIPLLLWLFFLSIKFFQFLSENQTVNFLAHYKCMYLIFSMAFFPIILIFWMFKKAFPTNAFKSGLAASLASGGIALFGIKIICPYEAFWHVLLWHIVPYLSLGLLGSIIGKKLFKL